MSPLVRTGLAMLASPVRIGAENPHRQSNACQGKDSRSDEHTDQGAGRHREKARGSQQSDKAQDRGANSPEAVSSPVLFLPALVLGSSRGFDWVVTHAAASGRGVPQAPLDICRAAHTADAADRSGLSTESGSPMAPLLDEVAISAPPLAGAAGWLLAEDVGAERPRLPLPTLGKRLIVGPLPHSLPRGAKELRQLGVLEESESRLHRLFGHVHG